jgi:DNA polymerase-3 subunit alpha
MLLKKLEVDNYLGLVAASSIIRPGVSQSGMMREYILRHKDPERRKLAHPVLWDIMPDTYGVMVYQEDVIKVAHHFAGLDLGEADVLRRGMSGKYRSRDEFLKVKQKFFANCNEKGHDPDQVAEIWRQIESFAGYAFAKGHSASYAVESYQSLYLKCYYPLEYMVATLNNGGGYYKAEFYIHEARMCGGHIHLPHINNSDYLTRLEGNSIYLGFCYLQNFELAQAKRIMEMRQQDGAFSSLDDFLERVPIGMEQLEVLIRIDAFRELHPNKRKLLWQAYLKRNKIPQHHQQPLFRSHSRNFALPELQLHKLEQAFDELELLGFALGDPFELLERPPATDWNAVHMKRFLHRNMELYGYLVSLKKTKTSGGKLMFFGTFLDRQGAWIDTVHFPPVAKKYPFRGRGIYRLRGKVMEEFGFLTLEVNHMEKMAYVEDRRYKVLD